MSAAALETEPAKAATGNLENPGQQNHAGNGNRPVTTRSIEADLKRLLDGGEPEKPETATGEEPQPEGEQAEQKNLSPEEQAAAEAEAEAATNAEENEGNEAERKEWPESFRKRIDKLTAQKGELKSEVETHKARVSELEQQLEAAKTAQPEGGLPAPDQPLGFIKDARQLSEYTQSVKAHVRNIEDFLDGAMEGEALQKFTNWAKQQGAVDAEGEINNAKLKQIKRMAQDTLTDLVPQRLSYFQEEARHSQTADKRWPWLTDKNSPEYKKFEGVVRSMPGLKALPHWKAVAAIYVRGLMAEEAATADTNGKGASTTTKTNATTAAKGASKAPIKTPGAASTVPAQRPTNSQSQVQALRDKANRTRDPKDFQALVKAQLEESMA